MKSWLTRMFQVLFVVLVVCIAGTSIANAATIAASVNPSFRADLMNTLKPQTGTGNATFSRGTTATVVDFEGLVRPVLSGEARFVGARRVQNLLSVSEWLENTSYWSRTLFGSWNSVTVATNDGIAPDGSLSAEKITSPASGSHGIVQRISAVSGHTYVFSIWVKNVNHSNLNYLARTSNSGTPVRNFDSGISGSVTTSWQRFTTKITLAASGENEVVFGIGLNATDATKSFYVWGGQVEDVTGQANQNPSEYVSTGKLSAPYQGANVDGVQYFKTLNGNTYDPATAVISQSTGDAITSSTAKYAWVQGSAGNYFSTPDTAVNSITGDLDIRAKVAPDSWTAAEKKVVSKANAAPDISYLTYIGATTGKLAMVWSPDGTNTTLAISTVAVPFVAGEAGWVRYVLDVDNGAGGNDVKFYTSTNGVTWTQLGSTVTNAGTTSIFNGTGLVQISSWKGAAGDEHLAGNVYRAQIYRGINGILAVDFNPNSWTSGSTWRSLTGETWTMNGSAIVFGGAGVWDSTGPLGYLAEGVRTNLFTYSEQFDNAIWTKGTASIVANATTSPDGTVSADKFMEDSSNGGHFIIGGPGSTSGHSYTVSMYAKAAGRSAIRLGASTLILGGGAGIAFSLTGAGSVIGAPANCTGTINYVGNGWYRVTMTLTATLTGGGGIFFNISDGTYLANYQGDGASGLYIWGASMEDNAVFASSYIPTTSGSVTRNSDILSYGGSNISNVFSATFSASLESTVVDPVNWRILLSHTAWPQLIAAVQSTGNAYKMVLGGTHVDTGVGITATHMKMGIRSGSDNAFFVGGTKTSGGTTPSLGTGNNIQVGSINGAAPAFGSIRELKIWKKPLSDSQFIGMTTNNNPLAKALIPQTTVKTPTKNGLVGQWSFNEGSGTKANDTSGLGNNGTLQGSPTWVAGKVGKALNFNGTNYASLTRSPFSGTSFSIAGWVKLSALQDKKFISALDVQNGIATKGVAFGVNTTAIYSLNPNSLYLQTGRAAWIWSGWTSPANSLNQINQWYHVGVTVTAADTATPVVTFYINGVPQTATVWSDGQGAINYGNTDSSARIGGSYTASNPGYDTNYFNGATDDLQVYNRALSATEMANLAKSTSVVVNTLPAASSGSGLVGLWSFDGKDMNWTTSTAYDRSGAGNNGSLINMSTTTSPVIGKIGQGLKFTGTGTNGSYVNAGSGTGNYTNNFTLATWFKLSTTASTAQLLSRWDVIGAVRQYLLRINDANTIVFYDSNSVAYSATVTGIGNVGTWHHATVVVNGSSSRIYVDGVAVGSVFTPTIVTRSSSFLIGALFNTAPATSGDFNGSLDDTRIYNRALSATEVKALYNSGR